MDLARKGSLFSTLLIFMTGGKGTTKGNCYNCGKPGHFVKECRRKNPKLNNIRASAATMEESHLFVSTVGRRLMECWLIDSGASQHQTPRKDWFAEYKDIEPRKVFLGDNHALEAIGIGSVKLALHVGGRVIQGTLTNVLHVPELSGNLMSVSKMVSQGMRVQFDGAGCKILAKEGNVIGCALRSQNLYKLDAVTKVFSAAANVAQDGGSNVGLWHRRLGHIGMDALLKLRDGKAVDGLNLRGNADEEICWDCVQGKQQRQKFPKSISKRAANPLELVHSDVCGPMC
jgi:hypothetical protein